MGMWALDSEGVEIAATLDRLPASGQGQGHGKREEGGNNVYHEVIPVFLDALPAEECEAWIAMEMIETPRGVSGYLVRAEVISELGIFGYALFGKGEVVEREVGWLV
ncbi:hypothetical protein P692DRAFT_20838311, partial [Suillus brevipes Sb2]